MNLRKPHQEILKTLWGVDIAKFPAHLSTINLAVNDLSVDDNYPQILNEDFFNLSPIEKMGGDETRKKELKTLSGKKFSIPYPRVVDCIIGNPPYTRQEEITEITGQESYKDSMINKALLEGKRKLADISKRAGIHAYFFVHGTKFLKEGGRFGFIVSNSWMDVDYGKGLQELFLMNYKIVAIIESKVERWFEDADVNTCIIILEKCKDQKERDDNLVRFVYLFKPLRHFIPPAHDMWEKQKQRLDAIEKLEKTILAHNDFYQNDELRIYPKKQNELWDEGFDKEEGKYTGSKWGKYLRAPEIFFKILEKGKDKLVPLKEIADVRFGIKTGANEFFYLTEEEIKERDIEKEFWMHKDEKGQWVPNKVFVKANELESPVVKSDSLQNLVLFIKKDKKALKDKKILSYIRHGERSGFHERPTCASRMPGRNWHDLGENIADIIAFPERVRQRYIVFYNPERASLNKNLYGIEPQSSNLSKVIALALNSTLTPLYTELFARQPGGGGGPLDIDVYVAKDILTPKAELLKRFKNKISEISFLERKTETIFDELGANTSDEVSLDKVKPDRRELDKIIMGDILGLTENEQLEVYLAVVDLVRSRIEKAKSVEKKGKTKEGFDIELLTKTIKEKLGDKLLGNFYREKILSQKDLKTVKLFHPTKEIEIKKDFLKGGGWLLLSGKDLIECQSETEAEYLKVWLESGLDEIKVPQDESYISKILQELKALKEKIDEIISDHISSITSQKLQQKILQKLQGELFG